MPLLQVVLVGSMVPSSLWGRSLPGWHLSISTPSRNPTWEEIKQARYDLCPHDVTMAMILPAQRMNTSTCINSLFTCTRYRTSNHSLPANLEALQGRWLRVQPRWHVCPECGEGVEVWKTPGQARTGHAAYTCELLRPAIRHYERCNIAPKQEEQSGPQGNQRSGIEDAHGRGEDSANARLQEPVGTQMSDSAAKGGTEISVASTGERVLRDPCRRRMTEIRNAPRCTT